MIPQCCLGWRTQIKSPQPDARWAFVTHLWKAFFSLSYRIQLVRRSDKTHLHWELGWVWSYRTLVRGFIETFVIILSCFLRFN